jgi:hypothetical protein
LLCIPHTQGRRKYCCVFPTLREDGNIAVYSLHSGKKEILLCVTYTPGIRKYFSLRKKEYLSLPIAGEWKQILYLAIWVDDLCSTWFMLVYFSLVSGQVSHPHHTSLRAGVDNLSE